MWFTGKILLDKQIAQLPDTQEKARRTKVSREHTKEIESLNQQKKKLMETLKDINNKVREHAISINTLLNSTSEKTTSSFTFKCPHPE